MQYFDSVALAAVVAELRQLGTCRIDKVGQPATNTLYLKLRAGRMTKVLLIECRERWARMHLTSQPLGNLKTPGAFTMLLRKHLEGSRLLRVEQPGWDRVARLVVAGRDELGDPYERYLVIELIGAYANACLIDGQNGLIMGCLRPVTDEMCQVRQLLPGLPYQGPPISATKVPFTDVASEDLASVLQKEGRLLDRLSDGVSGISKLAFAQILVGAGIEPSTDVADFERPECLWRALESAQADLQAGRFTPRLTSDAPWAYSMWPQPGARPEPSASAVLAAYYEPLFEQEQLKSSRHALLQTVLQRVRKSQTRLRQYSDKRTEASGAESQRVFGELIYAHLQAWQPGMTTLHVTNYYEPAAPSMVVTLDPRLSGSDNAQRYFRRYQKLRQADQVLEGLIAEASEELAYLEQLQLTVEQATSAVELREIADEVRLAAGDRKAASSSKSASTPAPESAPLVVWSSDDVRIWVGRNNHQNDRLTFKMARGHDWWLHAQNLPGAHVIIDTQGDEPSETTLYEAALLAAWFSRGRQGSGVPVVYTRRRHVRKMRQGRPGMVHYTHESCMFVRSDADAVAALLARVPAADPHEPGYGGDGQAE